MPIDQVEFMPDWYDRLVAHTNEKTILPEAIRAFAQKHQSTSCLEIGLGTSPFFANRLGDLFSRYLIIEKQIEAVPLPHSFEFLQEDWESFKTDEKFDVVIASHVMYYFKNKRAGINKIIDSLSPKGSAFIVVNGKDGDYGPLKNAFSKLIGQPYSFTYDELVSILRERNYIEHSVPSHVAFDSSEDLFETLRLSFDQYPEEYEKYRGQMIEYFTGALPGKTFTINQKIFEVRAG